MITLRRNGVETHSRSVRLAEYEPLEIEVRTGAGVSRCPDVLLDGSSIGQPTVVVQDDSLHWRWTFQSESWCGRAVLTISSDQPSVDVEIHAVPSGSKYSEDEYDIMLERVIGYGEGLAWGLAPGQGQGIESAVSSLGATHPAFIKQHLQPLLLQLGRVLATPVMAQRRTEMLLPHRPTRPLMPSEARWLASRPDRLDRIRSGDTRVVLIQHRRNETYDHPANRYLVTLLRRLEAVFRQTGDALAAYGQTPLLGALESARATHLARRTMAAAAAISAALNHPVLAALDGGEFTESVSLVFAGQPTYARFAALARRMLRPGIRLDNAGDLSSSLRRSWDLFEIYCLFRLAEVLEEKLGSDWTFQRAPMRRHVLAGPEEGLFWRATRADGWECRIFYQQHFGHGVSGPGTITTSRKPDFVLTVHQGEALLRWTMLDAKYRSAPSSISDALESMHVYRDSLRWRTAHGSLPATGGFLLVPQILPGCLKFSDLAFRKLHGIGVIDIQDDVSLGGVLDAILN